MFAMYFNLIKLFPKRPVYKSDLSVRLDDYEVPHCPNCDRIVSGSRYIKKRCICGQKLLTEF